MNSCSCLLIFWKLSFTGRLPRPGVLTVRRQCCQNQNIPISKNIFMMLNKMNIRHNNVDESDKSNYVEYVAKLSSDELENWYDELYQLMLLAILELDNVERTIRINTLRSEIAHK